MENGCFGPSIVGVVFQQTHCTPGQMTLTNEDEDLGVRDEVEKGCGYGIIKIKRPGENERARVH